jgi:Spy/CpxP family protein refolding chaperone
MVSGLAFAQHAQHGPATPYAGQEERDIKGLSAEDIAELRRGGGWGFAKPAELNGMPGPAHLLELKDQIGLRPEQAAAIQSIFDRMRANAIHEGERLIALEQALDEQFRGRSVTDRSLREVLAEIEKSRQALRYIHLAAHLETPTLLTPEQVRRYNQLRGYSQNPCGDVPAGHDPVMWRRHNGCN